MGNSTNVENGQKGRKKKKNPAEMLPAQQNKTGSNEELIPQKITEDVMREQLHKLK